MRNKKPRNLHVFGKTYKWSGWSDWEYGRLKIWDDNKKVIYDDICREFPITPGVATAKIKEILIERGELDDVFLERI